ncbi:MAG: hypothetical protein IJU45_08090 [Clostridia bacterium]|nr:hypothetical protein [Clostridia bacterium]
MNSLQAIQTISKVGKIISKIVYICCIVGFCLCIVGIISLAAGAPTFKLGGVTIESFLQDKADMSPGTLYASLITGAIICAGEGILAKFAEGYFKKELEDGTPFTLDGAKELMRLGILSVAVPAGIQLAANIAQKIVAKMFTDTVPPDFDAAVSITVGALVIIMSLICRYGAEQNEEKSSLNN